VPVEEQSTASIKDISDHGVGAAKYCCRKGEVQLLCGLDVLNSTYFDGTEVPVEEQSTASIKDISDHGVGAAKYCSEKVRYSSFAALTSDCQIEFDKSLHRKVLWFAPAQSISGPHNPQHVDRCQPRRHHGI
jgi:hypothetical protein